jgi:hypothetical protein
MDPKTKEKMQKLLIDALREIKDEIEIEECHKILISKLILRSSLQNSKTIDK